MSGMCCPFLFLWRMYAAIMLYIACLALIIIVLKCQFNSKGVVVHVNDDFDISEEDERRTSKIGNLKKKAINASNKFTHSLKKRGKRKMDSSTAALPPQLSIQDVRDANEETAVLHFRQNLLQRDLLPPRHDDYHTLLRSFLNLLSTLYFPP